MAKGPQVAGSGMCPNLNQSPTNARYGQRRRLSGPVAALLVVTILAATVLLWATVRGRFQNRVTIENDSGQPIRLMQVTTAGKTIEFKEIPDTGRMTAPFEIKSDDSFAVECRLADGTVTKGGFGYVTHGMYGQRVRFTVEPGGRIVFDQK